MPFFFCLSLRTKAVYRIVHLFFFVYVAITTDKFNNLYVNMQLICYF